MAGAQAKILVIIPAHNEAESIGRVIADLQGSRLGADLLVIDDGSSDATAAIARATGRASVISLPYNLGIGGAVQTGFLYAVRHGYRCAVQFDGDGQHLASEIPKILGPLNQGLADAVIGSRYSGHESAYRTPFLRRLGMIVFQMTNSLIIGQRVTDNTSGFRSYNRRALEFLADHYPDDYPEPEAVIVLGRNGFRITEVAVTMRQRADGRSSISGLWSVYYMVKVLLTVAMNGIRAPIITSHHAEKPRHGVN